LKVQTTPKPRRLLLELLPKLTEVGEPPTTLLLLELDSKMPPRPKRPPLPKSLKRFKSRTTNSWPKRPSRLSLSERRRVDRSTTRRSRVKLSSERALMTSSLAR